MPPQPPRERDQAEPREPGRTAPPVLAGEHTFASVSDQIGSIVLTEETGTRWWLAFLVGFLLLMLFFGAIAWLLEAGVGIWGINIPVAWGFAIVNFVWWIGIGHAGTLISTASPRR